MKVKRIGLFIVGLLFLILGTSKFFHFLCLKNNILLHDRNSSYIEIEREKEDSVDVLVLGDSLSYTSVSTMDLWKDDNIAVYICGQPGQYITETYSLLQTALKKQKPKLVILETNVLFRKNKKFASTAMNYAQNQLILFRYHNFWKQPFLKDKSELKSYKGFQIRSKISSYNKGEYMKETFKEAAIGEEQRKYLGKIAKLCKDNKAQLLLFSTASPKNYNYKKHNALAKIALENGARYLDMNLLKNEVNLDWKRDTLDKGDHLNIFGARKVTSYLGAYLKEHYHLSSSKNKKNDQSWNRLENEFFHYLQKEEERDVK